MAVFTLKVNSHDEWLKERKKYIGGSDASCILGANQYKSNVDLYYEKTGQIVPEDISNKPCVKFGTEAEEHIRELFRLAFPKYTVEHSDNTLVLNDKYPFAHASLDGVLTEVSSGRKGILEIKTSQISNAVQKSKWRDRIPQNYYVQLLHYLMVTEFDFAILVAYLTSICNGEPFIQIKHYKVERADVLEDIKILGDEERSFYSAVKNRLAPSLVLPTI